MQVMRNNKTLSQVLLSNAFPLEMMIFVLRLILSCPLMQQRMTSLVPSNVLGTIVPDLLLKIPIPIKELIPALCAATMRPVAGDAPGMKMGSGAALHAVDQKVHSAE
jgi:hypothetical protein